MKLLILGGTRFVGRHLVAAALGRSHEVTLFNRGTHPAAAPKGVETIQGDRGKDLARLEGRRWDAVIDTCGYLPRTVRASAQILSHLVGAYVFISSVSAYADFSVQGVDETAPLATLTSEQLEAANSIDSSGQASAASYGKMYGGLKARCELAAEAVLPHRVLIIRPGLIVGPEDYTDRFTYWVQRVARGNEIGGVLAPGRPDRYVQFIDVRDLAEWIVRMIEREETGVYNANGLPDDLTMAGLLSECKLVTDSDASFTWVSEDFLLQEKVAPWSEMPLWMPEEAAPHLKGFMSINCSKAISAGLNFRPLADTIRDTLARRESGGRKEALKAGIDDLGTGREHILTLVDGMAAISSIAFSHDGRLLATADESAKVKFWDVASGRLVRTLVSPPVKDMTTQVVSLALAPDGRVLATGEARVQTAQKKYNGVIKVWDLDAGRVLAEATAHVNGARFVGVQPDGLLLASGGADGGVKLWDAALKTVKTLSVSSLAAKGLTAVSFEMPSEIKLQETPVGLRMLEWWGNVYMMSGFAQARFARAALARTSAEDRALEYLKLYQESGELEFGGVERSSENEIVIFAHSSRTKEWKSIKLQTEGAASESVILIEIGRIAAPPKPIAQ
jgi:2'-hydroxyisoflavone reductase